MGQFANDQNSIAELLNRVLTCKGQQTLYIYGESGSELNGLYPAVKTVQVDSAEGVECGVIYIRMTDSCDQDVIMDLVNKTGADCIIHMPQEIEMCPELKEITGSGYDLQAFSAIPGKLCLTGPTFCIPKDMKTPEAFRVLAVVHFFNEEDVLARTIDYLLDQSLDIYLLDNWSTDRSYQIAKEYKDRYPNRIYLERFPASGASDNFSLYDQMARTEELSKELQYDWFIHYDADEIRVSPFHDTDLRDTIYYIDQQGYDGIENTVIDFRLTDMNEGDIFGADTYFSFRHEPKWVNQLKTWKRTPDIDLKKTGGHHAWFQSPKLYPLKILNRHYPMRSIEQASKKVFKDRKPRFTMERGTRGWHGHYEKYQEARDLLFDKEELILWTKDTYHDLYIPLFTECGLRWERKPSKITTEIHGEKTVIYGCGNIGREAYLRFCMDNRIVGWVDKQYMYYPASYCVKIAPVDSLLGMDFDRIVIAVKKESVQDEIVKDLITLGIPQEKIVRLQFTDRKPEGVKC